ncbi:MAG: DUF2442 domain-containing protein [Thermodesulfobacteriota bacterium]
MRQIKKVVPRRNFFLVLEFDNGEVRLFDVKPYLRGTLFEPLKDEGLFRQVEVEKDFGGLVWPNGADLCADMVYMHAEPVDVGAVA